MYPESKSSDSSREKFLKFSIISVKSEAVFVRLVKSKDYTVVAS